MIGKSSACQDLLIIAEYNINGWVTILKKLTASEGGAMVDNDEKLMDRNHSLQKSLRNSLG